MLPVELHPNAASDLRQIKDRDPASAAYWLRLIQQMKADPQLNDQLLQRNSEEESISVKRWEEQYRKGLNLWRIRSFAPAGGAANGYRLLYAFIPFGQGQKARFCILAVTHRSEFNYEQDSELARRIINDYQEL